MELVCVGLFISSDHTERIDWKRFQNAFSVFSVRMIIKKGNSLGFIILNVSLKTKLLNMPGSHLFQWDRFGQCQ